VLRGCDPAKADEWVIVSAHYDHLGVRGEVVYPGADDNASGVAMMLEVARSFVEGKEKPKRSIMFVGFDLEESGLFGSRYFVEHMPVPLGRIALFVTADMIGRSLGGVCGPDVFVMGSEHAPEIRPWIESAAKGSTVKVGLLGADLLLIDRSDYGPFRSRKVPFLFFSTGENPNYHRPSDIAETLNYPKLEAISRIIFRVVRQSVDADAVPSWKSKADNPFSEALTVRDVLRTLLDHREDLKIGPAKAYIMGNTLRSLDGIAKRGTITPEERGGMVRAAQIVLASLF
jgi:Zn-dependent M28 family amino/carboxypeptidase